MLIYPETLELAALAAEHLGNSEQSAAYRAARDMLTNELGIDTSHFPLFL
jgi:hypothetical protein